MILFFPQYQGGSLSSTIPVGTSGLRAMLQDAPGFTEVPLSTKPLHHHGAGGMNNAAIVKENMQAALQIITDANPDFILTTGGDCGTAIAPISYLNQKYKGKIGVLWIDAHADIHVPSTSPSGTFHGMPVRMLMGHPEFWWQPPVPLLPSQIAYLGLRSTEEQEDVFIAANAITHFSDVDIMTSNTSLDSVLARFRAQGLTHLHLHVDCDVMDVREFPHVVVAFPHLDVPAPGGLSVQRLIDILQYLRQDWPLAGCCLTEYAPRVPGAGLDILRRIYTQGLGLQLPV